MKKSIILIGLKNCGKSSVGQSLATQLNYIFIDTDDLIENNYFEKEGCHKSYAEIYQARGKDYFAALEKRSVLQIDPSGESMVIATGGSTVLDPDLAAHLSGIGQVIYLQASYLVLQQRWQKTPPAFVGNRDIDQALSEYYKPRALKYLALADRVVDVDHKSTACVVDEIVKIWSAE